MKRGFALAAIGCFLSRPQARRATSSDRRRWFGQLETLESRQLLAVTASFHEASGALVVNGDKEDNEITLGLDDNGSVLVNGTPVQTNTGELKVMMVTQIEAFGQRGNDTIIVDDSEVVMPPVSLYGGKGDDLLIGGASADRVFGGDGADVLRGGAGNDTLIGGRGNDVVLGQDGSDLLIVNNGDGSDMLEGGEGFDFVQVNGANGTGDYLSIELDGERVQVQHSNLKLFTLNIGTAECLNVNGQGKSGVIVGSTGRSYSVDADDAQRYDVVFGDLGQDDLVGGSADDF